MTRIVSCLEELDALGEDWERLLAVTPSGSGFQGQGWIRTCWQVLPQGDSRLRVLVAERSGRPSGILPMQLSRDGNLSFVGSSVSNYSGPVVAPEYTVDVINEWLEAIAGDRDVHSADFANLREGDPFLGALRSWRPARHGPPRIAMTNICPEVDLSAGWDAVYRLHGSRHRYYWRAMGRRLETLGAVSFEEISSPDGIRAAMADLFGLWDRRWAGRWTSAAFSPPNRSLQTEAARSGVELLSALRVDGRMIAFSLGVRANGVTTSYVIAHDDRLGPYRPGTLLLLRILEAAATRGDPAYDFSLGAMPYKSLWANRERPVYRALWGRGGRMRALRQRLWVSARSIDWLRDAKVEGGHRLRQRLSFRSADPDSPGIPTPRGRTWTVWQARSEFPPVELARSEVRLVEMERRLSPRLFGLALERAFRGDRLFALSLDGKEIGLAWLAGDARRSAIAAASAGAAPSPECWYGPVRTDNGSLEELAAALLTTPGALVASSQPLVDVRLETAGRIVADPPVAARQGGRHD